MIVVLAGSIGRFPVGGHAWVDLQYLLGLRELGCDVYYLEECGPGSWVYDWQTEQITTDLGYPTEYLRKCLEPFGLGARWIYRAGDAALGMDVEEFRGVCERADLLILRGVPLPWWREEYAWPRRRAFVDCDPGFTQFRLASGSAQLGEAAARCERHFTVGQGVGEPGCGVPEVGLRWHRMLPPVALSEWPEAPPGAATHFSSVLQWRSYKEVEHAGVRYGNKDREFPHFLDLPRRTAQPFRMALTGAPPEWLARHGWDVVSGWLASLTTDDYRRFIQASRAEFGVAKHGYVATRSGWFSDRSACYLASGRPVLVQETGLPDALQGGRGLLTFRDADGALRAIDRINADYAGHCRAARALAEEHFAAGRVLSGLLEVATG